MQEEHDEDITAMMNMPESQMEEDTEGLATPAEDNGNETSFNIGDVDGMNTEEETETTESSSDSNTISVGDMCSVSDMILSNVDKHIKMQVVNTTISTAVADADVANYIVYVNTDKKIPCIFDCERLYLPKSSVQNSDGTWNVTSIEGRRSGIVVKCPGRDIIMTKNFVYDCELDANGNIAGCKKYSRVHKGLSKVEVLTIENMTDYDSVVLLVRRVLPKSVKSGKFTTLETLKNEVKERYEAVDDINAMKNIIELRVKIGC